jgi:hypothetical protein
MRVRTRYGSGSRTCSTVLGWLTWCVGVLACVGSLAACSKTTPTPVRVPTPTVTIRHRDALPLVLTSGDLGGAYEVMETQRLEPGIGWGDDTTRLSGYRTVFRGKGVFSSVACQVECYLSVKDAQDAYRAYREQLAGDLEASASYESVRDSEVRLLGDWSRRYTAQTQDVVVVHQIFLRENVFVDLTLFGSDAPEFSDQADRLARSLDERIFQR